VRALLASLLLLVTARSQEPALRTLRYESPGGTHTELDLARPTREAPGLPTVLLLHGGAWRGGARGQLDELRDALAAQGFWVVNADYTLATPQRASWPQALLDVKAVVRWIRSEGHALGCPRELVVLGLSAGAQLAALLGTTAGVAELEPLPAPPGGYAPDLVVAISTVGDFALHVRDLGRQDGGPGQPGSPVALFLGRSWSPHDVGELREPAPPEYRAASPVSWIDARDPPFLLLHGTADPIVEFEQSRCLDQALDEAGVPALLLAAQGAGHGFAGWGGPRGVAALLAQDVPLLLHAPRLRLLGAGHSSDPARVPQLLPRRDGAGLVLLDAPPAAAGCLLATRAPSSSRAGPWPPLPLLPLAFTTDAQGSCRLPWPGGSVPGALPGALVQALVADAAAPGQPALSNAVQLAAD
jgi:acetyl esterase/lipase